MTTAPNPTTAARAPWRAWLLIVAAFLSTFAPGLSAASMPAPTPTVYPVSGHEPAPSRACARPENSRLGFLATTTPERVPRACVSHGSASGSEAGAEKSASGVHVYLYAHANPVSNIDPSGHMSLPQIATVAAVVGITARIALPSVSRLFGFSGTTAESRIDGVLRFVIGFATAISAQALGPVGVPLMVWGLDEASAGMMQLITGRRVTTMGGRALAYGIGLQLDTAESSYSLLAAGPTITKALADIGRLIVARGPQLIASMRSGVSAAENATLSRTTTGTLPRNALATPEEVAIFREIEEAGLGAIERGLARNNAMAEYLRRRGYTPEEIMKALPQGGTGFGS